MCKFIHASALQNYHYKMWFDKVIEKKLQYLPHKVAVVTLLEYLTHTQVIIVSFLLPPAPAPAFEKEFYTKFENGIVYNQRDIRLNDSRNKIPVFIFLLLYV